MSLKRSLRIKAAATTATSNIHHTSSSNVLNGLKPLKSPQSPPPTADSVSPNKRARTSRTAKHLNEEEDDDQKSAKSDTVEGNRAVDRASSRGWKYQRETEVQPSVCASICSILLYGTRGIHEYTNRTCTDSKVPAGARGVHRTRRDRSSGSVGATGCA